MENDVFMMDNNHKYVRFLEAIHKWKKVTEQGHFFANQLIKELPFIKIKMVF